MDDSTVFIVITIVIVPIIIAVLIIGSCSVFCKFRHRRNVATFDAPVVITQQTYQANVGPYPVSVQAPPMGGMQQQQSIHPGAYPMPQPVPGSYPHMQHGGPSGYPMPQPTPMSTYPPQTPYPVGVPGMVGTPYPPVSHQGPAQNPPPYDQAVTGDAYQKQSPYNPNYGGN